MPNGNTVVCATFKLNPKPFATFQFNKNKDTFVNKKEAQKAAAAVAEKLLNGVNIDIEGYASPEGEGDLNQNLSEKRNAAVLKEIKKALKKAKKDDQIEATPNGADWKNLEKFVENSKLSDTDKNAILTKVRTFGNSENEIRGLMLTYPQFEKSVLELQRRVDVYEKK